MSYIQDWVETTHYIWVDCDECRGTGLNDADDPCMECEGQGRVQVIQ